MLVHNDFRMGNFVVDRHRLSAVLDWELASTGSPLADLSWCFIPVWAPVDIDVDAMIAIYEAESGRAVDRRALSWFGVLGHLRLLYYCLSAGASLDRSTDLRLAALRLWRRCAPIGCSRYSTDRTGHDDRAQRYGRIVLPPAGGPFLDTAHRSPAWGDRCYHLLHVDGLTINAGRQLYVHAGRRYAFFGVAGRGTQVCVRAGPSSPPAMIRTSQPSAR